MPLSDRTKEYLEQVCGQIRWKKAHPAIKKELEQHLQDQAQAFEDAGCSPEEAADLAVREMGDPVMVGAQLDRSYRPKFHWPMLITVFLLMVIGFALRSMMYGAYGMLSSLGDTVLVWLLSIGILMVIMKIDYTILLRTRLVYGCYLIGAVVSFCMSHARGFFSLLPPYFFMAAAPLVCASFIYYYRNGGLGSVGLCSLLTVLPAVLLGGRASASLFVCMTVQLTLTAAVLTGVFSRLRRRWLAVVSLLGVFPAAVVIAAWCSPRFLVRLKETLIPEIDPIGFGYMILQVRGALAQAKLIGPIEDMSLTAGSIPLMGTDYILTWMICRFGWVALFGVLALALALLAMGVRAFRKQSGVLAKAVACAVFMAWLVQILSALAVNLGLVSSFSFPFLFFGGNVAIVANMVLLGMLLSVCQMQTLGSQTVDAAQNNLSMPFQVELSRRKKEFNISIKW